MFDDYGLYYQWQVIQPTKRQNEKELCDIQIK